MDFFKSKKQKVNHAFFYLSLLLANLNIHSAAHPISYTEQVKHVKFRQAIESGDLEAVRKLIDSGFDVNFNIPATFGESALTTAIKYKNREMAELLINKGADVNAVNIEGRTPLINAARSGVKEIVELLINNGADVNAVDIYGTTPLMEAARWANKEIAELLIKAGDNINAVDTYGNTALILAAWNGKNIAKLLIDAGANIDVIGHFGRTALMRAVERFNKDLIDFLIDKGANTDFVDKGGETAMDKAKKNKSDKLLESAITRRREAEIKARQEGVSGKLYEHTHLPHEIIKIIAEYESGK